MRNFDLERIARDAELISKHEKLRACLKNLLASVFVGLLLCSPIFYQMGVDNGWWSK